MKVKNKCLNSDWKAWIWLNISRGCSKDGIFKILIDNGFDYDVIKEEIDYEPSQNLEFIVNPLQAQNEQQFTLDNQASNEDNKIEYYFPNATKIDTDLAEIYFVDDFLPSDECQKLIELIKRELLPSTITNKAEEDTAFRTSQTCSLSKVDHPLVHDVDRRICQYLGINSTYSEGIQGQHYEVGNEFKAHTDYFEANELQTFGAEQGQRTWTFMIYLNDTPRGGETIFKKLGKSFHPKTGQAVIWNSLYPDGRPNPDTLHQSIPVEEGDKTIITKWYRSLGTGKQYVKTENETVRSLTSTGFKLAKLPESLFEKLSTYLEKNSQNISEEIVKGFIKGKGSTASELIELSQSLKLETHKTLQPILEEWSGIKLEPTYVYGLRRYRRGAYLEPHRDRLLTHTVSATINIFQDVEEDWPLEIEDHYYRRHKIVQAPGEMIMYEGARLLHGRPSYFKGESYTSMFVHYKPKE